MGAGMSARTFFAIIGFVTCMGWIADFLWGASVASRDISPDAISTIPSALGYALVGVFADG